MTGAKDLRSWAALVVGAFGAAVVLAVAGMMLEGGPARAATPTGATVKASPFFEVPNGQTGEAFAKCGRGKRVIGGGVVQSAPAKNLYVEASGPLDATGFTSETSTGGVAKQRYAAVSNFSRQTRSFKVFAICE